MRVLRPSTTFIRSAAIAVFVLLIPSILWERPVIATALLVSLGVLMLVPERRTAEMLLFIFGAVLGTVSEIIAVSFGTWQYAKPSLFEVPFWLPPVWGNASVFVKRIADEVVRYTRD